MRSARILLIGVVTAFLITFASGATAPKSGRMILRGDSKYRVFCANNKLEVEQRTLEQEKSARGSNVCQLAEFDYLSDAEKYAENHGGKGSDCKCD